MKRRHSEEAELDKRITRLIDEEVGWRQRWRIKEETEDGKA